MGNAGSHSKKVGKRASLKPSDDIPPSSAKEGEAFVFAKKSTENLQDEENNHILVSEPHYSKAATENADGFDEPPPFLSAIPEESKSSDLLTMTPTVFKWRGGGIQVYLSGSFNEWKNMPMFKSHGDFVIIVDLPEGDHHYKFFVDGEWRYDPRSKLIDNGMGSKYSLVTVIRSDFEVFQALDQDSASVRPTVYKEYGQIIPQFKASERMAPPPILPPHLLQVILNKDIPVSCEPTLLPEPNHVMLNHLYALSMKDNMMVLSSTHRYRKKYVTTLLYKSI